VFCRPSDIPTYSYSGFAPELSTACRFDFSSFDPGDARRSAASLIAIKLLLPRQVAGARLSRYEPFLIRVEGEDVLARRQPRNPGTGQPRHSTGVASVANPSIRELEHSGRALTSINAEALLIDGEYQSTNVELDPSKEHLQSVNEALAAANDQLRDALEHQRRTSDDLQNILNCSDVATLFLDEDLNVRFFTPSAGSCFNLGTADVGRPLARMANPFVGIDLIADARTVLAEIGTIRREVRSVSGARYICRISPYRARDNRIEGIVVVLGEICTMKAVEEQTGATPAESAARRAAAALRIAGLTRRQREVMELVVAGRANKEIAAHLGIAQRTVENHRAAVMQKTGAASLSDLVRLVIGAGEPAP
jgi:DNA-binding CsgD family transcriptional regulator/PAS domain-containing protein